MRNDGVSWSRGALELQDTLLVQRGALAVIAMSPSILATCGEVKGSYRKVAPVDVLVVGGRGEELICRPRSASERCLR